MAISVVYNENTIIKIFDILIDIQVNDSELTRVRILVQVDPTPLPLPL